MLEATRDAVNQLAHDCRKIGALLPTITHRVIRLAIERAPAVMPVPYPLVGRESHREAAGIYRQRLIAHYIAIYGAGWLSSSILPIVVAFVVEAIMRRWWGSGAEFRRTLRTAQIGMGS